MLAMHNRLPRTISSLLLVFVLAVLNTSADADSEVINFESALMGANFDPDTLDFNGAEPAIGNGIPDAIELALVAAVLADPTIDFSETGGVSHEQTHAAFLIARDAAANDLEPLLATWSTSADIGLGYALLGQNSLDKLNAMTSAFGAPMSGDYSQAVVTGEWFSASGDADGDGFSNLQEFSALTDRTARNYVAAALDPSSQPDAGMQIELVSSENRRRNVGIVLYPGFEVLDVYGPLEMWAYVPDFNVILIAEEAGPVMSAQRVATVATHSFETAPLLDIVMVPGGTGTRIQLENQKMLDFLEVVNETTEYTTSVCTGSALLAKAGILNGHRATTNKRFFFLSEQQSKEVDWVVDARWVESGKMFTSSGVSAGTDMALGLISEIHGIETARQLASAVEYEWHEDADDDPFSQFVARLQEPGIGLGELLRTEPGIDAQISTAPNTLRLYFDKLPIVDSSNVSMHPKGSPEELIPLSGMHNMGANDLMLGIDAPISEGSYVVNWNAEFGGNVEPQSGQFEFTLTN